MNCPVYTFGSNAHPAAALSLRDALVDTFPTFKFEIEMISGMQGFREAVVLLGPTNTKAFERMVTFSQGFIAGFGGGVTPPTRLQAQQRTMTRTDCPAAKRKSDPPPPSEPTLPSQKAPKLASKHPTMIGIPAPSIRLNEFLNFHIESAGIHPLRCGDEHDQSILSRRTVHPHPEGVGQDPPRSHATGRQVRSQGSRAR